MKLSFIEGEKRGDAKRCFRKRLLFLFLLLILFFVISISVGSSDLSAGDSLRIVLSRIPGLSLLFPIGDISESYQLIVLSLRLPRALLALLSGASLALVGACFQAVFRNPLADPHILGVSSGAAFGASCALVFGMVGSGFILGAMGSLAFLGALAAVWLVYIISGGDGRRSAISMILAGTALTILLSSLISLMMIFNHEQLTRIYFWTMGSFNAAGWAKDAFVFALTAPASILLLSHGRELNLLLSGEEEALSMGLDTAKLRRRLIILASLMTAATVSVSGIIGFVGLIVPHSVRLMGETDMRRLLPLSALAGAAFLLLCDTLARTILSPVEIPVGIMTAIFGVPFFFALMLRQRGGLSR